ncbi:ABC transporter substrate-binding protein [Candidatus Omnitrophota bacterium]
MNKNVLVIALVSMLVVSGCAQVEEKEPIKIGMCIWPGWAHAYVAKEKGFFEKYNVDVELVLIPEYVELQELYKAGELEATFTLLPDVIIMNSEGISTKIVYVADYSITGDVIIGKPEFTGLDDLKGKKVGVEGINTFSHLFVLAALEKNGMKEGDVFIENVPALDVLTALEEGRIVAGHTWEPVKSQALDKGYKVLAYVEDTPGIIVDVLAFKSEIVNKRPDDVKAIIKALLEARDFIFSNKDEAVKIMAEAEGMSEEEMASGIEAIKLPDLKENVEAMTKSGDLTTLRGAGMYVTNFFLERGQISQFPDFDKIIDNRFVKELLNE